MANFYASKEWVILFPPDVPEIKKAAEDMSQYIGLLAGLAEGLVKKPPALMDAHGPEPSGTLPLIILNCEGSGPERNGFSWRAGPERVEIYGESGRGLCNGIYSFLAALGVSWPAPGETILPSSQVANLRVFPLSTAGTGAGSAAGNVFAPSTCDGNSPLAAPWKRYVPSGKKEIQHILKKSDVFVAWAARRCYDALVFPMAAFASRNSGRKLEELRKTAAEYGISLEAGGRELSTLVPRRFFLLHRDFFRMDEGRRKTDHHFCPTNPGAIALIGKEGVKLFRAASHAKIFHLWPDKGADKLWCSCPTCRAFTPAEQNRIAANAAADVLADVNPGASVTFSEKSGEGGKIPLRKNLFMMERLPDE